MRVEASPVSRPCQHGEFADSATAAATPASPLEVRIIYAQTSVAETAALAALVQCLARRHAQDPAATELTAEALAENRFIASRDGIAAELIRAHPPHLRPLVDAVVVELATAFEGPPARRR